MSRMGKSTTVVMTGGTSGFGKVAVDRLAETPNLKIIMGARHQLNLPHVESHLLDLSSLESVRKFASNIIKNLNDTKINALILNAGMILPNADQRTVDGFETTFAVNHLSQYLLLRLLLPHLDKNATVSITTSATHNPNEKGIYPPPRHANFKKLAHPDKDEEKYKGMWDSGGHAYSASKLCNVLTARALAAHPESITNKISVIAFDPGPIPGTDISRNYSIFIRTVWKILSFPLFPKLVPRLNSKEVTGDAFADIILGKTKPPEGGVYVALRNGKITYPQPSELALDDKLMKDLWTQSAELIGLTE